MTGICQDFWTHFDLYILCSNVGHGKNGSPHCLLLSIKRKREEEPSVPQFPPKGRLSYPRHPILSSSRTQQVIFKHLLLCFLLIVYCQMFFLSLCFTQFFLSPAYCRWQLSCNSSYMLLRDTKSLMASSKDL